MKKTPLFLIALSALTLASCSQEEPVSVRKSNEAISFRSGMATRATEINNSNLSAIYATAFNTDNDSIIFENELFSKGSDSFFTSTKQYY